MVKLWSNGKNGSNILTITDIIKSQILTRTPQNGEKMKITNE